MSGLLQRARAKVPPHSRCERALVKLGKMVENFADRFSFFCVSAKAAQWKLVIKRFFTTFFFLCSRLRFNILLLPDDRLVPWMDAHTAESHHRRRSSLKMLNSALRVY